MKIDLQKTPIWTFSLTGNGDRASLIRFSKTLQQQLTDLPNIDSVTTDGLDDQEVQIVVKPDAISTYNVNPQQLMGAVSTALNTFPAGNVNTTNSTFSLTINPQIKTINDIRLLKVNLNGQIVSLSDIADVYEKSKPGLPISAVKAMGLPRQLTLMSLELPPLISEQPMMTHKN